MIVQTDHLRLAVAPLLDEDMEDSRVLVQFRGTHLHFTAGKGALLVQTQVLVTNFDQYGSLSGKSCTVGSLSLFSAAKRAPHETTTFEFMPDSLYVNGNALPPPKTDQRPDAMTPAPVEVITLPRGVLLHALDYVSYAVGEFEPSRPWMRGIHFLQGPGDLHIAATNGHRMAYMHQPWRTGVARVHAAPTAAAMRVVRTLLEQESPLEITTVRIGASDEHCVIAWGSGDSPAGRIVCQNATYGTTGGTALDIRTIVPATHKGDVTVQKDQFLVQLRSLRTKTLTWRASGQKLHLTGNTEVVVDAEVVGNHPQDGVVFDAHYLYEMADHFPSDTLTFFVNYDTDPLALWGGPHVAAVMPCRR